MPPCPWVRERRGIPREFVPVELPVLMAHLGILFGGPTVLPDTCIRLLLPCKLCLQLAYLVSGNKLRAALADLAGMLDVLYHLVCSDILGNILPKGIPNLLDKLLGD